MWLSPRGVRRGISEQTRCENGDTMVLRFYLSENGDTLPRVQLSRFGSPPADAK